MNWIRCRLLGIKLGTQLDALARGPTSTFLKFQGYEINGFTFYTQKQDGKSTFQNSGYEINGFTFYTQKQDGKSTFQNSGVRFDAHDENGNVQATYYGFIEKIWELAYGPLKAALFRCQWVWLDEINTDREGFTTVDLTKTAYRDDPFVLARDVMQVFYARDNVTKGRLKVALEGKRKIVRVEGVTDEEDYRGYHEMPPFGKNVALPILEEGDEPAYVRHDHNEVLIVDAPKKS